LKQVLCIQSRQWVLVALRPKGLGYQAAQYSLSPLRHLWVQVRERVLQWDQLLQWGLKDQSFRKALSRQNSQRCQEGL